MVEKLKNILNAIRILTIETFKHISIDTFIAMPKTRPGSFYFTKTQNYFRQN